MKREMALKRAASAVMLALALGMSVTAEITVAPLSLKIPVPPGGTGMASFVVHNVGQRPADVRISLHDWWRTPEGKFQVLPPGTLEGSCAPWLVYSRNAFVLEPGEEVRVTVRIEVPEGETGDRWALLLVAEYPPEAGDEEGALGRTRVVMAYAVKILRRDPVNAFPAGEIREVEVMDTAPLRLRIVYVNTGNAHTVNRGTVEVRDVFGETVRSFPIEEFPTLPGEERILVVEDPTGEPLPEGIYYAFATIDFGGEYLVQGGILVRVPRASE
ncbi:MAG: hypothetical protein GXO72_04305 [Caldiserica bacterium]|nr:hypothetical protein [Caldisericota bacterium]